MLYNAVIARIANANKSQGVLWRYFCTLPITRDADVIKNVLLFSHFQKYKIPILPSSSPPPSLYPAWINKWIKRFCVHNLIHFRNDQSRRCNDFYFSLKIFRMWIYSVRGQANRWGEWENEAQNKCLERCQNRSCVSRLHLSLRWCVLRFHIWPCYSSNDMLSIVFASTFLNAFDCLFCAANWKRN